MTNWHRLFGLFLMDLFTDSPYVVELEKDLSQKQQFLDVVILRKEQGRFWGELPDGLDNLADYNLLSYKSLHEPLDDWALKELAGHYVNYRKQVSPSLNALLPESQFQLYGISTRFPKKLGQRIALQRLNQGVYEVYWGTDNIRVIVLSEIPAGGHNAIWRLFSAKPKAVMQAREQYHVHQADMSTIVQQLFENYQLERIDMTYTVQDFQKDYVRDHLNLLSPDEVLKRYSPDERLKDLSPDDILSNLSPANLKVLMEKIGK
ncbi:MAG: hypothetical protein Q8L68_05295 [Methylococcales bacterium]|nr:hypothetical protein [Methylococcales bacterium]